MSDWARAQPCAPGVQKVCPWARGESAAKPCMDARHTLTEPSDVRPPLPSVAWAKLSQSQVQPKPAILQNSGIHLALTPQVVCMFTPALPHSRRCVLLLIGLVLAWASLPAYANRVALVIGNDTYQKVEPLRNARNDARLMAGVLKQAGFDVTQGTDLTREGLWKALDTFKGRINKGDEVVFYFAGHGVQIGASQLLLPIDIAADNEAQVVRNGVPLIEVQDALKDARVAVLLLDACRDNPFPKTGTRTIGGTRGLSPPDPSTGQLIMMSAGRNQKALDRVPGEAQANGLFTWELSKALQTPGLEIRAALEQVKESVDEKARRAGHEQRPSLVNDLSGKFYLLASVKPEPDPERKPDRQFLTPDAEQEAWELAKKIHTVTGYQQYLKRYEQGRYAQVAKDAVDILQPRANPAQQTQQQQTQDTTQQPLVQGVKEFKDCADCPEMVVIPAGSFIMGSDEYETEFPLRQVNIRSFALGKFEVTQVQWKAVMGSNPSHFKSCGDNCPVEQVSWNDIQQYIQKLNQKTGKQYRLPSEAEWEHAARAGTTTRYSWGNDIGRNNANCRDCDSQWANKTTAPVGSFKPNAFGLHDMHGNVLEWVQDVWHANYQEAPTDSSAWTSGGDQVRRVLRSGSWGNEPRGLRSAYRSAMPLDYPSNLIGFRVARTVP